MLEDVGTYIELEFYVFCSRESEEGIAKSTDVFA